MLIVTPDPCVDRTHRVDRFAAAAAEVRERALTAGRYAGGGDQVA